MLIPDAIEILKNHNKWRRGDDSIKMVNPTILGKAIDTVVNSLEVLIDSNVDLRDSYKKIFGQSCYEDEENGTTFSAHYVNWVESKNRLLLLLGKEDVVPLKEKNSNNCFLQVGGDASGINFEHTLPDKESTINYLLEQLKDTK